MDEDCKAVPTFTDDDSITTSTESEAFETWTLVKEKNGSGQKAAVEATAKDDEISSNSRNYAEIVKEDKRNSEDEKSIDECLNGQNTNDSNVDELSDGISVISDSESGGRMTPHPFLREHLNNLNLQFGVDDFDISLTQGQTEQPVTSIMCTKENKNLRRRPKSESSTGPITTNDDVLDGRNEITSVRFFPLVRHGFSKIFFVAVALAVLAIIGRWHYPVWESFSAIKTISRLEQKLSDIELQNNLMRAEVDILTKQVNYLSNLNGKKYAKNPEVMPKAQRDKSFKAWSGNGESLDPVDITKRDLKRSYKCPDGKFVEIAGMCVENKPDGEALVDQIERAVNEAFVQTDSQTKFEETISEVETDDNIEEEKPDYMPKGSKVQKQEKPHHQHHHHHAYKSAANSENTENENRQQTGDHFEKRFREHFRKQDKIQHNHDNSRERYDKRNNFNSKERYSGRNSYGSKEKHEHSRKHRDGEWQEKLMRNRENARYENEKQYHKNWFIERGDNREERRHS